jgi:hypothetical protein
MFGAEFPQRLMNAELAKRFTTFAETRRALLYSQEPVAAPIKRNLKNMMRGSGLDSSGSG